MFLRKFAPIFILVLLVGCTKSDPKAGSIEIGSALPLSGPVAYYGDSAKKGMDIAIDEINAAGGIAGLKIEVFYEDTRGTAKDSVSAMRKLVDVNQVPVVVGAGTSTETLAITKIAESTKTVLISPASSAAEIREAGEFIFRSVPSDGFQAEMLAQLVYEQGVRKVGLVFVNSSWGASMKKNFVRTFESLGGEILTVQTSEIDDKDFRTAALNLKQSNPDAIVAITYAKGGGRLVKQARELGIATQLYGTDPWTIAEFLESAGESAEGCVYTTPGKYEGPEFQEFKKKYEERYGEEPNVYAGNGYDCIKLIAKCIESGARTGPEIQAAMATIQGFSGVSGTTTFDEKGDVVSKEFRRMTIKNGKSVPFKP